MRSEQPVLVIGENKVTESTPRPRLQAINRQQMILRAMDVEQLIPEDHEARAIWEFVGQLNLSRYYQDIRAVEGKNPDCSSVSGYIRIIAPQNLSKYWLYILFPTKPIDSIGVLRS